MPENRALVSNLPIHGPLSLKWELGIFLSPRVILLAIYHPSIHPHIHQCLFSTYHVQVTLAHVRLRVVDGEPVSAILEFKPDFISPFMESVFSWKALISCLSLSGCRITLS